MDIHLILVVILVENTGFTGGILVLSDMWVIIHEPCIHRQKWCQTIFNFFKDNLKEQ